MPKESPIEISAYGNILLNSEDRLKTFIETVSNWQAKISINMKIRIRGKFATEAIDYCKNYGNIQCKLGSDYIQWRNQALDDVKKIESRYIIIFLEDQYILGDQEYLLSIITSMKKYKIDILQYSWKQHYQSKLKLILEGVNLSDQNVYSVMVNKDSRKQLYLDSLYMISLTSIFRKDFLEKLLKDPRPILRKYDARGPFDVEKSRKYKKNEPYVYGLPVHEFAVCVDDEMGIAGSSAIERGLVKLPKTKRGVTHYSKFSPKFWISNVRPIEIKTKLSTSKVRHSVPRTIIRDLVEIVNITANTIEFFLFEVRDSFIGLRKENKN
jgi:hypothetical protein